MNGPERLREYLEKTERAQNWLAGELGVASSTVHYWCRGAAPRTMRVRRAIQRLTRGAVPADSWESESPPAAKTGS